MTSLGVPLEYLKSIASPGDGTLELIVPSHFTRPGGSSNRGSYGTREGSGLIVPETTGHANIRLTHGIVSYIGDVVNGIRHGQGKIQFSDGTVYSGSFSNGVIEGKGTIWFADGSVYNGEVSKGHRHGFGEFVHAQYRVRYVGNWVEGRRHGYGTLFYDDTTPHFYAGYWVNDRRDGQGILNYASGNVYIGTWKEDKKSGVGRFFWFSRGEVYIGTWENDKQNGSGVHTWYPSSLDRELLFGDRLNPFNVIDFTSMAAIAITIPPARRYDGSFVDGLRNGFGCFLFNDGSEYLGEWWNDMKHGSGLWLSIEGVISEAYFNEDLTVSSPPTSSSSSVVDQSSGVAGSDHMSTYNGVPNTTRRLTNVNTPVSGAAEFGSNSSASQSKAGNINECPFIFRIDDKLPSSAVLISYIAATNPIRLAVLRDKADLAEFGNQLRARVQVEINKMIFRWLSPASEWYKFYSETTWRLGSVLEESLGSTSLNKSSFVVSNEETIPSTTRTENSQQNTPSDPSKSFDYSQSPGLVSGHLPTEKGKFVDPLLPPRALLAPSSGISSGVMTVAQLWRFAIETELVPAHILHAEPGSSISAEKYISEVLHEVRESRTEAVILAAAKLSHASASIVRQIAVFELERLSILSAAALLPSAPVTFREFIEFVVRIILKNAVYEGNSTTYTNNIDSKTDLDFRSKEHSHSTLSQNTRQSMGNSLVLNALRGSSGASTINGNSSVSNIGSNAAAESSASVISKRQKSSYLKYANIAGTALSGVSNVAGITVSNAISSNAAIVQPTGVSSFYQTVDNPVSNTGSGGKGLIAPATGILPQSSTFCDVDFLAEMLEHTFFNKIQSKFRIATNGGSTNAPLAAPTRQRADPKLPSHTANRRSSFSASSVHTSSSGNYANPREDDDISVVAGVPASRASRGGESYTTNVASNLANNLGGVSSPSPQTSPTLSSTMSLQGPQGHFSLNQSVNGPLSTDSRRDIILYANRQVEGDLSHQPSSAGLSELLPIFPSSADKVMVHLNSLQIPNFTNYDFEKYTNSHYGEALSAIQGSAPLCSNATVTSNALVGRNFLGNFSNSSSQYNFTNPNNSTSLSSNGVTAFGDVLAVADSVQRTSADLLSSLSTKDKFFETLLRASLPYFLPIYFSSLSNVPASSNAQHAHSSSQSSIQQGNLRRGKGVVNHSASTGTNSVLNTGPILSGSNAVVTAGGHASTPAAMTSAAALVKKRVDFDADADALAIALAHLMASFLLVFGTDSVSHTFNKEAGEGESLMVVGAQLLSPRVLAAIATLSLRIKLMETKVPLSLLRRHEFVPGAPTAAVGNHSPHSDSQGAGSLPPHLTLAQVPHNSANYNNNKRAGLGQESLKVSLSQVDVLAVNRYSTETNPPQFSSNHQNEDDQHLDFHLTSERKSKGDYSSIPGQLPSNVIPISFLPLLCGNFGDSNFDRIPKEQIFATIFKNNTLRLGNFGMLPYFAARICASFEGLLSSTELVSSIESDRIGYETSLSVLSVPLSTDSTTIQSAVAHSIKVGDVAAVAEARRMILSTLNSSKSGKMNFEGNDLLHGLHSAFSGSQDGEPTIGDEILGPAGLLLHRFQFQLAKSGNGLLLVSPTVSTGTNSGLVNSASGSSALSPPSLQRMTSKARIRVVTITLPLLTNHISIGSPLFRSKVDVPTVLTPAMPANAPAATVSSPGAQNSSGTVPSSRATSRRPSFTAPADTAVSKPPAAVPAASSKTKSHPSDKNTKNISSVPSIITTAIVAPPAPALDSPTVQPMTTLYSELGQLSPFMRLCPLELPSELHRVVEIVVSHSLPLQRFLVALSDAMNSMIAASNSLSSTLSPTVGSSQNWVVERGGGMSVSEFARALGSTGNRLGRSLAVSTKACALVLSMVSAESIHALLLSLEAVVITLCGLSSDCLTSQSFSTAGISQTSSSASVITTPSTTNQSHNIVGGPSLEAFSALVGPVTPQLVAQAVDLGCRAAFILPRAKCAKLAPNVSNSSSSNSLASSNAVQSSLFPGMSASSSLNMMDTTSGGNNSIAAAFVQSSSTVSPAVLLPLYILETYILQLTEAAWAQAMLRLNVVGNILPPAHSHDFPNRVREEANEMEDNSRNSGDRFFNVGAEHSIGVANALAYASRLKLSDLDDDSFLTNLGFHVMAKYFNL